jgi:hypothetical protein
LRVEAHGAREAEHLSDGFDADLPGPQGLLDALPRVGLEQQLARVEHQVSAVRAVEGARFDQVEVRHERPELRDVLHHPEDVGIGGMVLVHDRRPVGLAVVDQDIDAVTPEGRPAAGDARQGQHRLGDRGKLGSASKVVHPVDDVLLQGIEVLENRGQRAVCPPQPVDHLPDGGNRDLFVQLLQSLPALPLPVRDLTEDSTQLFAQLDAVSLDLPAPLLRQLLEFVGRQDPVSFERR